MGLASWHHGLAVVFEDTFWSLIHTNYGTYDIKGTRNNITSINKITTTNV